MFIFGILIHELGHLLGGLVMGYRLLYIEVFGVGFETVLTAAGGNGQTYSGPANPKDKDPEGIGKTVIRIKRFKDAPVGQCLMYHESLEKCPIPLIAGGIFMNLMTGTVEMILSFSVVDLVVKTVFLIGAIANISLTVMNLFGSDVSDGRTLKETLVRKNCRFFYNGIMLINMYIRRYGDIKAVPEKYMGHILGILENDRMVQNKMQLEREIEELIRIYKA